MSLLSALTPGTRDSKLHCWDGGGFDVASWSQVVRDAEAMTGGLRRAGVRPGARVASVLTNGPHAVRGALGVWLAGGALASLPVPARGMSVEEYQCQLERICATLEPEVFAVESRLLEGLPAELRTRLRARSWESFLHGGVIEACPPQAGEAAFVQYSSGSTNEPKGCVLTMRAIEAQIDMIDRMIGGERGREVTVSWLPLSHDMGMFGTTLGSLALDYELVLSTPERFMLAPRTWFQDMAEFGGTLSAGTSTALHMAARACRVQGPSRPLRLRTCIIGAERVDWTTLKETERVLGPCGLRFEALMPAYGLAEATLAVTATPQDEAPRSLRLDSLALADGEPVEAERDDTTATLVVGAGVPCAGVELVGLDGRLAEIRVRSPSLADGYLGEPQRTRERFRDGVLETGDLGFVRDGHLYLVGRCDDLISIAGRNVYAGEVELAVDAVTGTRRGCSTLVDSRDGARTRLTLFVEMRDAPRQSYSVLARQAASIAMAKAAVALDECVFLPAGSLPKTPSGKIQRHRARQMWDLGRFEPLATIELAAL
jgi:acyl-CoA synthetase (AMP-forming)/AMP-acid ligase II